MIKPIKILPLGGCQLAAGITPLMESGRAILTTNLAGVNAAAYTMSEVLQRIRFARGDVEIPAHLRYFCNFSEDAKPGSAPLKLLEQADVVLLEPNTTLDIFFGPYALHRSTVLTGFLNSLQTDTEELSKAASLWWHQGLFGRNRGVQREAAEILIPALRGRTEHEGAARKILLEARVGEQDLNQFLDSVSEFCGIVDVPVGLVTFVYSYLPDGRPIGWPADFIENTAEVAKTLSLPVFDSASMVNRYGLEVALDEHRKLYRKDFQPIFADELLKFSEEVIGRRGSHA